MKKIKKEDLSRMKKISLWTDGKFKVVVIGTMALSILTTSLLLKQTRPLEDKYQKLMNTKQLYIIDPAGQKYITSASKSQNATYRELAKILVKKMYEFNSNDYQENLSFVKNFTEKSTFDLYKNTLKSTIETAKLLGASYSVLINSMYVSRTKEKYIVEIYFTHEMTSKTTTTKGDFKVTYELASSTGLLDNPYGIYLMNYSLITGDALVEDLKERNERENKEKETKKGE
jgi:hypothetical protein